MYAAIRRYQIDPEKAPEAIQHILEDFVPLIRKSPGVLAYYVLEAQDGQFATLSVFESQAAVEASNRMASDWIKQLLASRVLSQERLSRVFVDVEETLVGPFYEGFSNTTAEENQPSRLLSVQEVCEALGMGKSWVYKRINSGELPSIKMGGSRKVRQSDLTEYLSNHRSSTPLEDKE